MASSRKELPMNLGVCSMILRLPENESLKGKRKVIKSLIARVRNSFNVAIAEVDDQDVWQLTTLGIACVSNNAHQNNKVLSNVVEFISHSRLDLEVVDYQIELIPFR
jgi:uncharacterized protein YlxP (DUF503 family)